MTEKTIQRICKLCKNIFNIIPSRIKHGRGIYCSRNCKYEAKKQEKKSGHEFTCLNCDINFILPPSKLKKPGAGKYCSRVCRDNHWVGKFTSQWQDGSNINTRGPNWRSIRRKIIFRDKKCKHCGESENILHVHHIIPFRLFEDINIANNENNLITLCASCHRKEEAKYKWINFDGGALKFSSDGYAWNLAKEKKMTCIGELP